MSNTEGSDGRDMRAGVRKGNNPKPSGGGRGKRKDWQGIFTGLAHSSLFANRRTPPPPPKNSTLVVSDVAL